MVNRLSIYFTPNRLSVTIDSNGVNREVTGNPIEVLKGMNPDDYGVLVAFCSAVVQHSKEPNKPSMFLTTTK